MGRRRQRAHLWHRVSRDIRKERARAADIGPRFQEVGQARDRFTRDSHIVVQAQDVFALGGAQPDIQGLGESEILGEPTESEMRKLCAEVFRAIPRAVVDNDDLMIGAEGLEVPAKLIDPIE